MADEFSNQAHVEKVDALFSTIAMRYDLVNDIQSAGLHRLWKRKMARLVALGESEQALDVCCGTGDLIVRWAKRGGRVAGVDMNGAMLNVARRRLAECNIGQARLYQADALQLPFGDGQFDVVTIAYGLRNLADYKIDLQEIFHQSLNVFHRPFHPSHSRNTLHPLSCHLKILDNSFVFQPEQQISTS